MDVAERHRSQITRGFYECSLENHQGLGWRYIDDHRFTDSMTRLAKVSRRTCRR
jgi:hypothetical protein